MLVYEYTAKDMNNKIIKGSVEAKDETEIYNLLREKSLILLSYNIRHDKVTSYKLKVMDIAEFARQISEMTGSGIPIGKALEIIRDCSIKKELTLIYAKLYKDVMSGKTLSEAMKMQGETFPPLLINMFSSAELSGKLETTAKKMGEHYEKEHRLNAKVKSAMAYPIILASITVIVVILVFTVILPQFFEFFSDVELPMITKIVMGTSKFLSNNFVSVIIGTVLIITLVKYIIKVPPIRLAIDKTKLRLPIFGRLNQIISTARFARNLSSLYSSGLTIINALSISSTIIGNTFIEAQFDRVISDIKNGGLLSNAIKSVDGFDKKLSATLVIAEESGKLDTMLENVANTYDFDAEAATTQLVTYIEPIMIVLMALIIGSIMLSVMMPLMSVYTSIGASA